MKNLCVLRQSHSGIVIFFPGKYPELVLFHGPAPSSASNVVGVPAPKPPSEAPSIVLSANIHIEQTHHPLSPFVALSLCVFIYLFLLPCSRHFCVFNFIDKISLFLSVIELLALFDLTNS